MRIEVGSHWLITIALLDNQEFEINRFRVHMGPNGKKFIQKPYTFWQHLGRIFLFTKKPMYELELDEFKKLHNAKFEGEDAEIIFFEEGESSYSKLSKERDPVEVVQWQCSSCDKWSDVTSWKYDSAHDPTDKTLRKKTIDCPKCFTKFPYDVLKHIKNRFVNELLLCKRIECDNTYDGAFKLKNGMLLRLCNKHSKGM